METQQASPPTQGDFQPVVKSVITAATYLESSLAAMRRTSPVSPHLQVYKELERLRMKLMDAARDLAQVRL